MHRILLGAVALLIAMPLAGCEDLITGGDLLRPGEDTGTIEVINGGSVTLDAVLITNCDASTYGLNRLPDGVQIEPGYSYSFTVSAGCWDVDAGAFGAAAGEARHRMTVSAGGITQYTVTS